MPEQNKGSLGILILDKETQLKHVSYEQIETAFAEVSRVFAGGSGAAVAAMVTGIDGEAGGLQNRDQLRVSSHVLAEPVSDLHNAAGRPVALPSSAYNLQAILAPKPEFVLHIGSRVHRKRSKINRQF